MINEVNRDMLVLCNTRVRSLAIDDCNNFVYDVNIFKGKNNIFFLNSTSPDAKPTLVKADNKIDNCFNI